MLDQTSIAFSSLAKNLNCCNLSTKSQSLNLSILSAQSLDSLLSLSRQKSQLLEDSPLSILCSVSRLFSGWEISRRLFSGLAVWIFWLYCKTKVPKFLALLDLCKAALSMFLLCILCSICKLGMNPIWVCVYVLMSVYVYLQSFDNKK